MLHHGFDRRLEFPVIHTIDNGRVLALVFVFVRNVNSLAIQEILEDVYETDVKRIKSEHTSYSFLSNTLSDDDKKVLIKENFKREFGARPIKKAVQNYIENKIIDNIYASANTDNDVLVPDDDYED